VGTLVRCLRLRQLKHYAERLLGKVAGLGQSLSVSLRYEVLRGDGSVTILSRYREGDLTTDHDAGATTLQQLIQEATQQEFAREAALAILNAQTATAKAQFSMQNTVQDMLVGFGQTKSSQAAATPLANQAVERTFERLINS
jgi:hypothetical protein